MTDLLSRGAPVEQMPFEDVDYWEELKRIMEWTKTNVVSTLHLCWGAQAGIYYHYGIDKYNFRKTFRFVLAPRKEQKDSDCQRI